MKALLALVVLVLVAGCGAADPPVTDPPPPVSTSSTPPAKPLSPEQTVRAWVRAYNLLARSGDSYALTRLSDPSCQTCTDLTSPVEDVIAAGGAYRGGDWRVPRTHVTKATRSRAVVDAYVVMTAGATRHRKGEPFHPYPAERHILEFTLLKDGGAWVLKLIAWL